MLGKRLVIAMLVACAALPAALQAQPLPVADAETVKFPSADGRTELTGYVFRPQAPGRYPGVVMMHGRAGSYSSLKRGQYDADALTMRHRMWGRYWAERGYVAIHVDSFGPRGYPEGFAKHSYSSRPAEVSEFSVRPLDAYGALAYLRSRADVLPDRIGLQGWSNGGMAVLSTMGPRPPGLTDPFRANGFRAAMAHYPGCRTQASESGYRPYAPLLLSVAEHDDEVSPTVCRSFAETLRGRGADLEFYWYDGAHHSYDDPGKTKQSHAPNRIALEDTLRRAEAFFSKHLKP